MKGLRNGGVRKRGKERRVDKGKTEFRSPQQTHKQ